MRVFCRPFREFAGTKKATSAEPHGGSNAQMVEVGDVKVLVDLRQDAHGDGQALAHDVVTLKAFDALEHSPNERALVERVGIAEFLLCCGYAMEVVANG